MPISAAGVSQCPGLSYGDVAGCLPNWLKADPVSNAKTAVSGHDAMLCPVLDIWRPNASIPVAFQVGMLTLFTAWIAFRTCAGKASGVSAGGQCLAIGRMFRNRPHSNKCLLRSCSQARCIKSLQDKISTSTDRSLCSSSNVKADGRAELPSSICAWDLSRPCQLSAMQAPL